MNIQVPPQYPLSTPTKIAFVGEAPSNEELEHGIPLVGPAGRVFNSLLRTANLDRREFLVTNVFNEKLPDNDVSNWTMDLREARERKCTDLPPIGPAGFLRPEHRWHLARLREEILDTRPNVIVPLGGTALWAFTGQTGISGQRGAITAATRIVPGAKLVPTFHPSFVIKQWKFFSVVVGDFLKAMKEAERGPKIILPDRELLIEPTLEEVKNYDYTSDLLSVDIETGWGQITCIGFAPSVDRAIVIPFVDIRNPNKSYWRTIDDEVMAWGVVKRTMENDTPKLGQNFAGYDALWLFQKYGIEPRNLRHDTRLLHHALYPELPKDLEFLGANYTQQGAWKSWGKRKKEKKDD